MTTEPQRRALASQLAEHALTKPHPWISLSALERQALRASVAPSLVSDVLERARDQVRSSLAETAASNEWLGIAEAASLLGTSPRWVRERLASPDGGRLLGYPWHDGRRWYIPRPACRPASRAQYLAALPDSEPAEHVALWDGPTCESDR